MSVQNIYGAYRKAMGNVGEIEILAGYLNDTEAQAAIRGIGATKEDFEILAKNDVLYWVENHSTEDKKIKLQLKAEYADNEAYLIYLNFLLT